MKISRMIILTFVLVPVSLFARDASQVSEYYNGGFRRTRSTPAPISNPTPPVPTPDPPVERVVVEEEDQSIVGSETTSSAQAPRTSLIPVARPNVVRTAPAPAPIFSVEPADPEIRFQGEPDYMEFGGTGDILARDRNAPVFQPFDRAFRRCAAPMGCTGASLYACRGSSCQNESGSCHNSGRAVDMNAIICNGQRHGPFSNIFSRFVQCIEQVRIGAGQVPDRTWKAMFRETRADDPNDCATINASNARTHPNRTICHWDHVHISMYCRNGRSY